MSEISFKTDPENTDYVVDNGAYRTFQAERIAEMEEDRIVQEKEEEEANNPMVKLENRTKESRREMDVLDALEEIRDWNARNAQVKFEDLMEKHLKCEVSAAEDIEKADQDFANKVFSKQEASIKRVEEEAVPPAAKRSKLASEDSSKTLLKAKLSGIIVKQSKKHEAMTNSLSLLADYSSSEDSS